ncbi:hypothetical protein BM525_20320 (plasmid) [Alteromonas mediterranea]|uniref:RNA polymerase sigma-70 domain-containing protein n=1 Tax=Alteromonas mediterranea TaxID=314275 RepID=A0AAC9JGP2_9ALTE|nr:sigma-70 family RNA polymerase sigma factor [Alteromonas mediterranea]APD92225.1 hypothetical protein BM524_20125 [Alteromonas mediterranea]APE00080.1 hypothetical protein BM525_20320 [Alteromonas mediterranea]
MEETHALTTESIYSKVDNKSYETSLEFYLDKALNDDTLSGDEEVALAKSIEKGDVSAFQKLVSYNTRLVVKIARAHNFDSRIELRDLISEGNFGLFHAAKTFDYRQGTRFSTYATWWIQNKIKRWIKNNLRTVRWPVHINERYAAYRRLMNKLDDGAMPSDEAIMAELKLTQKQFKEIVSLHNGEVSISSTSQDNEGSCLLDVLEDTDSVSSESALQTLKVDNILASTIQDVLSPREREVLKMRFDEERSLQDIAARLPKRVSPERVRQVIKRSLEKIHDRLSEDGVTLLDMLNDEQATPRLTA